MRSQACKTFLGLSIGGIRGFDVRASQINYCTPKLVVIGKLEAYYALGRSKEQEHVVPRENLGNEGHVVPQENLEIE